MTADTQTAEPAQTPAKKRGHPKRISSLDTVRGVLLLINVAALSILAPVPEPFKHARWEGVPFWDVIFPLFVTFSGVGLAFAYKSAVTWGRTFRRSLVLLAVGLVYNAIVDATVDPSEIRLTGPLQIYAVLVLIVGVLHLWVRSPVAWAAVTAVAAAVQAFILAAWKSGCPTGELLPTCNPSRYLDPAVFGSAHIYAEGVLGHDPEGIISTLGALVTILVGTTAGTLALKYRGTWGGPPRLLAWAAIVAVPTVVTLTFLDPMKRLWTTPFALGTASLGVACFAIGIVVMDMPTASWWERIRQPLVWPLVALGRNSLLVYFGSHLVMHELLVRGGEVSWAETLALKVDFVGMPRASFAVFMTLLWILATGILHKRKIYLRP